MLLMYKSIKHKKNKWLDTKFNVERKMINIKVITFQSVNMTKYKKICIYGYFWNVT